MPSTPFLRMRNRIFVLGATLILAAWCSYANAQDQNTPAPGTSGSDTQGYKVAIGIRFSSAAPTISNSVSIKYFFDETNAIEGLVSFGNRFGVGGLYEKHQLIGGIPAFTFFYGGGGYIGFQNNQTFLGPQGVLGLDYKFSNAPLNLSLDWKPELDFAPAVNFVPDAFGLTARFTFK